MHQTCVDDVLMTNYTHVNDTASLTTITSRAVAGLTSYRCEPFDCHGNGRCINGSCICDPGRPTVYRVYV